MPLSTEQTSPPSGLTFLPRSNRVHPTRSTQFPPRATLEPPITTTRTLHLCTRLAVLELAASNEVVQEGEGEEERRVWPLRCGTNWRSC